MSLLDFALPNSRPDSRMMLTERQLLQSVVEIARHVFSAMASSVFLIDAETRELVFEAVAGEGEGQLPGTRFAPGTGIVGWVASSGQSIFVDDLADNDLFARSAAESTGYVPSSLMAAPLIRRGDCIGVLEVLDPADRSRGGLVDLDLLALLASQASIGLDLLVRARSTDGGGGSLTTGQEALVARVTSGVRSASPEIAAVVLTMLTAVDDILSRSA
ncbi:GAF domain-containing protein [Kribbella sp. NBC_01245]|uniref:GAF domain-containing protein n=1 Tax=Kribbella sp. NBC_01245 TaxID=2903578 RepID=UPI002E29EC96|nr:GAF domain-containing protein [Kribbella sp. NBC_01245]